MSIADSSSVEVRNGMVPSDQWIIKECATKLKKDQQFMDAMRKLGFAYIGRSMLTMWHRPSLQQIKKLKEVLGITMIVTV